VYEYFTDLFTINCIDNGAFFTITHSYILSTFDLKEVGDLVHQIIQPGVKHIHWLQVLCGLLQFIFETKNQGKYSPLPIKFP
jgi:hypothetical protein